MSNWLRPAEAIPYGRQTLDETDIQAVVDVLKSPFLTQGPAITTFEAAVAKYCQVQYAVAFSSGTAALHGAYYAAGLGEGDEAITSPITFVATSNAVLYQGATPRFADINADTWNLDIEAVRKTITSKTKAIVPVHFAGQPVDLDAYYELADKQHLVVIEDAAHALGASYKGKPIGCCRDMAVFSFHPVKSITTGEGGMVVTPHKHYYENLLAFRTHGITKDTPTFTQFEGAPWEYEMQTLGYNYRMTDFQAALGVTQLQKLNHFVSMRQKLVNRYQAAFANLPQVKLQTALTEAQSAHHLFILHLDASLNRRAIFEALLQANIRPQVHYIPVHLQPYYQQHLATRPGMFPLGEAYYDGCISLPLYPSLRFEEQDYVIETVKRLLTL